jgi:CheY-like chemotaxis protein
MLPVVIENAAPMGSGQRILLLDDEQSLTKVLQQILLRLNYQVTTSNHAREAIDLCRSHSELFDLIITDLTMPELNGLEVAHQIHTIRPDLPILLISGFSSTLKPENLRQAGILDVIAKPICKASLGEALRRVFAKP